jgi:DNA-binding transcriptional LysR family regulator
VQLELISAPPAELERLLLEQRLDCAISYFSGNQAAFDYQPLFEERQRLVLRCGACVVRGGRGQPGAAAGHDQVRHPYRFLKRRAVPEPQHGGGEQIDSVLTFILSGRHIGYLPCHCAAPGGARVVAGAGYGLDFIVPFTLARQRGQVPGEAQRAFAEDLLAVFG